MNSKNLATLAVPPRARLLAALDGRTTDHVPVWLLFPYHPTSYYVDVRNLPAYQPVFEMKPEASVLFCRRQRPRLTRMSRNRSCTITRC